MRRLACLAGAALAAGLALAVPAQAGPAAALGQCTTTRGTIVAVDFGPWGGPVVRGCGVHADGRPDATGYDLLHDGGFTTAGEQRDGPAFVCRLGSGSFHGGTQYPTPSEDPCVVTPPASASWALWLAPPGASSWSHSSDGAMSDHPVAGGVELWTFGDGSAPPASLVDQLRAHTTTVPGAVAPPSTPPVVTEPRTSGQAGAGRTPAATGQPSSTPPTPPASSAAGAAATPSAGSAPPARSPGATPSVVAAHAAQPATSGGSAVPVIVTVVAVAALGGAGGLSLLRRRRRDRA